MEITKQIFQVGGSEYSHGSDAAVYLIKSKDEAALIDAGTGSGTINIIKNLRNYHCDPKQIKYIFITHCHYDHTGGINELRELTGAEVVAHDLAADFLEAGDSEVTAASWYRAYMEPTKIDIKIEGDSKKFTLGELEIKFHFTPGHSPGSSVYTTVSEKKKVLFGQDVHGPLNDSLRSNRSDYVESLNKLLSINADILCEGHFGVYHGKNEISKFIKSFL